MSYVATHDTFHWKVLHHSHCSSLCIIVLHLDVLQYSGIPVLHNMLCLLSFHSKYTMLVITPSLPTISVSPYPYTFQPPLTPFYMTFYMLWYHINTTTVLQCRYIIIVDCNYHIITVAKPKILQTHNTWVERDFKSYDI